MDVPGTLLSQAVEAVELRGQLMDVHLEALGGRWVGLFYFGGGTTCLLWFEGATERQATRFFGV